VTINLSELTGRSVLDISTALTIGKVSHAIIDPAEQAVVGFRIAKTAGDADVLPWEALNGIGPDALTVASATDLRLPQTRSEKRAAEHDLDPIGSLIVSTSGDELGRIEEIEVDPDTGAVQTITSSDSTYPGTTIKGHGNYAFIVVG
jgi:sporulation protein YlmC with PRC-barrel domain